MRTLSNRRGRSLRTAAVVVTIVLLFVGLEIVQFLRQSGHPLLAGF
jgi:hypothetical protein